MATGTVKWFNGDKGFGFIEQDGGGADVFAHYSAIQSNGYRELAEGQSVEFDVTQGAKGLQASRVSGTYTPQQALDLLLARTGLSYEFVNPRTVSIKSGEKRGAVEHSQGVALRLADTTPPAGPTAAPAEAAWAPEGPT